MFSNLIKKRRGFIGYFLVIVALAAAVVLFLVQSNNSSNKPVDGEQARLRATSILKQVADLYDGSRRMIDGGTTTAAALTFDGAATTGLYNSTTGAGQEQFPPVDAFALPADAKYIYHKTLVLQDSSAGNFGTAAAETAIVAANVTAAACAALNQQLYSDATIPASTSALADFKAPATSVTVKFGAAGSPKTTGCVSASGGEYVYYRVVAMN